ncbi:TadE/TadG family type IV pilus assembly protein [Sinimarinibacterium sp. NLF-5-8]|uniref:TadE/TadG family type IV pilus assembly protein n=1 Tax=Sinimarinibacterium sp. NLF-5-8 TaxID=2698684 RepID=UPI00137BDF41|nr:TadE/TadG family type IV pilus assembly protein [Sinimarinibacterium sp. NLF-5-8]QHS09978.1 pilus assembly protein [Sinimarinibacterium sp. NLF-5-8]
MQTPATHSRKHTQKGATAVEFALVFTVFFALFYALITYGLIFLMRMGLQHAAEDGVRAALRYPAQACEAALGKPATEACSATERGEFQYQARMGQAHFVAQRQASWMDGWGAPVVVVSICQMDASGNCAAAEVKCDALHGSGQTALCDLTGTAPVCGSGGAAACRVVVELEYKYGERPVIPAVPGFGILIPSTLIGRASLQIDGRALTL